jgi:hypothetical protein
MLSIKLIVVSANLSLLVPQMNSLSYLYRMYWSPPVRPFHAMFEVGLTVLLLAGAFIAIRFPREAVNTSRMFGSSTDIRLMGVPPHLSSL